MHFFTEYQSPVGLLTLASDGQSLCCIRAEGQKYFDYGLPESLTRRDEIPVFQETARQLDHYFSGLPISLEQIPLSPRGTEFQKAIWELLLQIPYGETISYQTLAGRYSESHGGKRMAAQAAASAVGHNPVLLLIPCHRVIGKNGSLTGFAAGLSAKQFLLDLEKTHRISSPKRGKC